MDRNDIRNEVIGVMRSLRSENSFNFESENVKGVKGEKFSLTRDFGLDSIDMCHLCIECEKKFQINLPIDIERNITLGEFVDLVEKELS